MVIGKTDLDLDNLEYPDCDITCKICGTPYGTPYGTPGTPA